MAKNFVNFEKSFITNRSSLRLFFCYYNCCCYKEAAPTFSETFPTNFLPKKWPLLKTLLSTMSTCPSPNVPSVAPTLAKFRRRFCGNYIFNYLRVRLDQSAVFREILKLETLLNKVKRGREMVGEITRRERNSLKFSSKEGLAVRQPLLRFRLRSRSMAGETTVEKKKKDYFMTFYIAEKP